MSLCDIHNPKRDMTVWTHLAYLQGTHLEFVNPESTPHCRSQDITCTHATAPNLTWITKPLEGPNSSRDVYHYFPVGYHRKELSNKHLPIILIRNNGPNEALEYVQAYADDPTVIT
jgi:hypothetical protein